MSNRPILIGVLTLPLAEKYDDRALKYLILYMNLLQKSFEYQLLPLPDSELIELLAHNKTANRREIEETMPSFLQEYKKKLQSMSDSYGLIHEDNIRLVILSSAKFNDNYYQTGGDGWSIIALGDWERVMAPPSIVEFFISLLVRTSIDKACESSFPTRHIGTKGCGFDFSAQINDARYFVLSGFLCNECKKAIEGVTSSQLLNDSLILLKKSWLGSTAEPSEASVVAKKLGHDLFHTMGVKPTLREKISNIVTEEATKGFISVVMLILGTALLVYLGLKDN